jgi:hypothetical protein
MTGLRAEVQPNGWLDHWSLHVDVPIHFLLPALTPAQVHNQPCTPVGSKPLRPPDGDGASARLLVAATYDCVVIGAGLRLPPKNLLLFETVVNTMHKAAPNSAIAFNTVPQDSADAAARWLKPA